MTPLLLLNPENAAPDEVAAYPVREAVRAVVRDGDGRLALLYVRKHGYYKLPGGGMEDGEDRMTALARECMEEIGCRVEVLGDVGEIGEYRRIFGIHQISYCYLARVLGEKGMPDFTEDEQDNDFALLWVAPEEAVRLLASCTPDNPEGRDYIVPRDRRFLAAALEQLKE